MIAVIAVVVIILACIAYFYLQCPVLNSIATVFSAIIGVIVAFNFYETLAAIMITKDFMPNWAHSICFLVLFVITTVVIRIAADQTIRSKIDFEDIAKYIVIVTCGIAAGSIVSGALIISLAMSPMAPGLPYARFDAGSGLKAGNLRPAKSAFTDSFTAWLFSQISKGSLSSDKSFAVFHTDFIDQIHLNRIKAGGNNAVATIADKNALAGKKIGVRKSDNRTIIRTGLKRTEFTLSQVRLIYKDKNQNKDTSGKAGAAYPEQCILPGKASRPGGDEENQKTDLTEVISLGGNVEWVDLVFKLPPGSIPVMLQFKQNAVTDLPKTVNVTDEIEQ